MCSRLSRLGQNQASGSAAPSFPTCHGGLNLLVVSSVIIRLGGWPAGPKRFSLLSGFHLVRRGLSLSVVRCPSPVVGVNCAAFPLQIVVETPSPSCSHFLLTLRRQGNRYSSRPRAVTAVPFCHGLVGYPPSPGPKKKTYLSHHSVYPIPRRTLYPIRLLSLYPFPPGLRHGDTRSLAPARPLLVTSRHSPQFWSPPRGA